MWIVNSESNHEPRITNHNPGDTIHELVRTILASHNGWLECFAKASNATQDKAAALGCRIRGAGEPYVRGTE